jgi:NADPH-dependent 2,4-dienoyl-CoA reductase/sulfur reductase-like enzyme
MRLVVIGADAAGMSAATTVLRECDDAEVVVVERGPFTSYSMCGIPYYVGGSFDDADHLVVKHPDDFRELGMQVAMRTEAVGIDAEARRVRVRDLETGAECDEPYDALLYTPGAHPVSPPLPGVAEYGHPVHTLDEGQHLRAHLDRRGDVSHVAVVGAGYIGLETAEALVDRGLKVTLVDRADHVMGTLDTDMAAYVAQALTDHGVDLRLAESLTEVRGEDQWCREVVTDNGVYPADVVVVALGAKPNTQLAAQAGVSTGQTGAVVVDGRMRTDVDGIWAAGDCVESVNLVSGARQNIQLGTHANKQGKIAGLDIAAVCAHGPDAVGEAVFPGLVGTAVTKLCGREIARTGVGEAEAEALGLEYEAVDFAGTARAGYMPDPGEVQVKMLAEAGTGRVLGAQLVGYGTYGTGGIAKRIDTAATWCQLELTVQQAQLLDLSYAPPFGGVWDVLQVGARKLTRELGLSPKL